MGTYTCPGTASFAQTGALHPHTHLARFSCRPSIHHHRRRRWPSCRRLSPPTSTPNSRPSPVKPASLIKIHPPPAPLIYAPYLQSLPLDRTASFLHLQPPAQHPRPRPMPPAHPSRSPSRPRPIPSFSLLGNRPSPICHVPSCPRHPVTPHARVLRPGPHSPSPAPSWPPGPPTHAPHNRSTLSPNSSLLSLVRPEKQPRHV